ncbi:MAG: J domain-containing protein [Eggerthellaceae bacterium]|nr:J domain-containing protein [Eggerthellaceae bacterium]
MTYFDHCASLDELKAAYKKLALKHHPDMDGNVRTMQEVNAEYDKIFAVLKELHNLDAENPESKARATTEAPEEFRAVVDALLKLEGIEVELCGSWLWIGGNTYPHREALKAAGCLWSRTKKRWYWRHAEDDCRWSRGTATMSEIRGKYGSEWLRKTDDKQTLPA